MVRYKTDFTNIKCLMCGKGDLTSKSAISENDGKGFRTGRWFCTSCYNNHSSDSNNNVKKLLRNFRTGNQNSNHSSTKGDKHQELACILYEWEDLNKKYDNYSTPIDCYNPKTELYHQVQGRYFNSIHKWWSFGSFEKEWKKKYETMVCFCFSKDGKTVERIYKFPKEIIDRQKGISIFKNPTDSHQNSIIPWYEEYRIKDKNELKKANEIWKKIIDKSL